MESGLLQYALQEVEALSLQQMLEFGRAALFDPSKVLASARHVQKEVRPGFTSQRQLAQHEA